MNAVKLTFTILLLVSFTKKSIEKFPLGRLSQLSWSIEMMLIPLTGVKKCVYVSFTLYQAMCKCKSNMVKLKTGALTPNLNGGKGEFLNIVGNTLSPSSQIGKLSLLPDTPGI